MLLVYLLDEVVSAHLTRGGGKQAKEEQYHGIVRLDTEERERTFFKNAMVESIVPNLVYKQSTLSHKNAVKGLQLSTIIAGKPSFI